MTSVEEKEKGAAAWAANNYPLAVTHFTNAIEIGGDKDFLKVVYSNRSVANLKLNKFSEAVADASKCIDLDSNWVKGHTRKGDALYSSSKFTEAFNAYNAAKRLSPADASLTEKCELASKAIRNEADRSYASTTRSTSTTSSAPPKGILGKVVTYSRYLLILFAVLYLLPLGRNYSSIAFRSFAALEILIGLVTLYSRYGFIKFNMEFAERVMQDSTMIYTFLGAILFMSRPYMFAMAPILLVEVSHLTGTLFEECRKNLPGMEAQVKPMLQRFMPSAANQDLSNLFDSSKEKEFKSLLMRNAAVCEVLQGVFLIVELVLPTRNTVLMFLWWQYLSLRYKMDKDGHVKAAFLSLDQRILSIITHRLCPKVVLRGYDMLKKYLADKVKPTRQSGPAPSIASMFSGLKSKCSVM